MANKMKTPILRPLRKDGATLYVFPSASEDIGLNLNNATNGVAMSHYALLNFTKDNFGYTDSKDIINDLLNYVLNHEISVINDNGYNYQEPYTVSEHILWHWLMKKNTNKLKINETDSTNHNNIWIEDWTDKNRLVQCFGSIDAGNSLSTEFGMFNETYVSIPTSYGNGPVFFRKVTNNNNYKPNIPYKANTKTSKIWGRDDDSLNYLGGQYTLNQIVDEDNSYKDETPIEIIKDIITIQKGCQTITNNANVIMNSYDEVNIDNNNDFALTKYNMLSLTLFNFNAILLYYSIYNNNDIYKEPIATNLFGIVFLDGGNGSGDYLLAPLTKKKSYSGNSSGGYFGNSYSFRVNIKTLSVYDNTDAIISDNTTITSAYSLDFSDVIYNLNRAIDVMNSNVQTTAAIQNAYSAIRSQNSDILKKFSDVSTSLTNYLNDLLNMSFETLNSSINNAIKNIESSLFGYDESLSSDGTVKLSTDLYINRKLVNNISSIKTQSDFTYGFSSNNEDINLLNNDSVFVNEQLLSIKSIITEMLDIIVSKNLNLTADSNILLSASDIIFNIKDNLKYANFSLISILEKIDRLLNHIEKISDNILNKTIDSSINSTEHNKYELENIISKGIIPIVYIILPHAKKPKEPGYYFKLNTTGNIINYVYFDGNEYKETYKCQVGKMYTLNGLIYVFNGETCKLLGE